MKRYFYIRNGEKVGPFSLEELSKEIIDSDTLVWRDGLDDWELAGDLEELKIILSENTDAAPPIPSSKAVDVPESVPAAQESKDARTNVDKMPKTWLSESILATIFCCLPFGIPAIVYAMKVESRFLTGDIKGAEEASKQAGLWTKLSLIFGIIYIVFAIIYGVLTSFSMY